MTATGPPKGSGSFSKRRKFKSLNPGKMEKLESNIFSYFHKYCRREGYNIASAL
jgi:hypothetical protein